MALVGFTSLLVAWGGCVWLAITSFRRLASGATRRELRRPVLSVVVGALLAMGALEVALVSHDFSIAYVADNHARSTPFIFTFASAWAALEGSILLWGLVLAGYLYAAYRRHPDHDRLATGAIGVIGMVGIFFFGLMITVADPFAVCTRLVEGVCAATSSNPLVASVAPLDGPGPNPLLQNHILMAVHPPLLYLGYVGFTVPFAYAISALLTGVSGTWLDRTRTATLVAWTFLTAGITMGALWSYEVLGWGGYWSWDPVENASLLPWLAGTAFLHSSVVERRRGMLRAWNLALVIGTFALTILGTFLTRSGIIASVHSFTQSAIGPALLGFLLLVIVGGLGLFATRAHLVAQSPRLESLASREGVFLLNNLLLTLFAATVLIGTLYPLFYEAFSGKQVSVGRPFFDRIAVPLSLVLLLAVGVGPVTPYRVARGSVVWQRLRTPITIALGLAAVAVLAGRRERSLLFVILTAGFVMAAIGRNFIDQTRRSRKGPRAMLTSDPGYWGGQIAHVGLAVVALGITVSAALAVRGTLQLDPGQQGAFAGFTLVYTEPFSRSEVNREVSGARIQLKRGEDVIDVLEPRLNLYPHRAQPIASPAVHTDLSGDVYLTLTRLETGTITLQLWRYPFQYLLWVGGLLCVGGGLFAAVGARLRRRSRQEVAA